MRGIWIVASLRMSGPHLRPRMPARPRAACLPACLALGFSPPPLTPFPNPAPSPAMCGAVPQAGEVVEFLVDEGSPVEYKQPVLVIAPFFGEPRNAAGPTGRSPSCCPCTY